MNPVIIIILIIAAALVIGLVLFVKRTFMIAGRVYRAMFVRPGPDAWVRNVCSFPENAENMQMFEEGMAWAEKYRSRAVQVSVKNDGLTLAGEYYDLGCDRTVIFLAGRAEALSYSYYFAETYPPLGFNVLVTDNRAHGLSEGTCNCVGLKEYEDLLAWIRFLNETYHPAGILLHGVCIGAAAALYAACDPSCPDNVRGLITEGMYVNFYESFKNHMIDLKKPVFPVAREVMYMIRKASGKDPAKFGPLSKIPELKKPVLMLHGKEDVFSLPWHADALYRACSAEKKLVWFEKGSHSHLRINAKEKYDQEIAEFVRNNF